MTRVQRLWMDRTADLIGVALVTLVATIAIVAMMSTSSPNAGTGSSSASSGGLPSCATVSPSADAQVSCRTKSATIELVQGSKPLLLQDVQVRLLRAERSHGGLNVRLRVRNTTDRAQDFSPGRRQVYLSAGGRRARPVGASEQTIAAQKGVTATLRFTGVSARRTMDIGIVPFALRGSSRPSTIGVIHLPALR
jgi:hypothetical protein